MGIEIAYQINLVAHDLKTGLSGLEIHFVYPFGLEKWQILASLKRFCHEAVNNGWLNTIIKNRLTGFGDCSQLQPQLSAFL